MQCKSHHSFAAKYKNKVAWKEETGHKQTMTLIFALDQDIHGFSYHVVKIEGSKLYLTATYYTLT